MWERWGRRRRWWSCRQVGQEVATSLLTHHADKLRILHYVWAIHHHMQLHKLSGVFHMHVVLLTKHDLLLLLFNRRGQLRDAAVCLLLPVLLAQFACAAVLVAGMSHCPVVLDVVLVAA